MSRSMRDGRRAIAAVELAVVMPVFLLLVIGVIEVGRAVMVQQILTNASREGARRAVLEQSTTTEVESIVRDYLARNSINGASASIELTDSGGATISNLAALSFGDPITVEVSISHNSVGWLPSSFFMGNAIMSAASTMQAERSQ